MKRYSLDVIMRRADNLSYIPSIVAELMDMVSGIDVDVHEIILSIKKDPGIVARVFKVANSSFYGRTKKAETLSDAVITMGLRGLKSLILGQAVKHVLTYGNVRALWEHAVKVSLASMVVSKRFCGDVSEDILIGGLMHDIGKGFIVGVYPETLPLINQKIKDERVTSVMAEESILGFDHTEVGALMTEKWNFPPKFTEVIKYHHSVEKIEGLSSEKSVFLNTIKFGNGITNYCDGISGYGEYELLKALSCFEGNDITDINSLAEFVEEVKAAWANSKYDASFY